MTTTRPRRAAAFLAAAGLAAVLAGAAVTGTGAYFTDSATGGVSAVMGSVVIDATGLQMTFADVQPGETRVGSATFTNHGSGAEDVWLVFDASALAVARQAGTIVTFEITGSNPAVPTSGPLGSLGQQYLLHEDLAASASGSVRVGFAISPDLTAGQGTSVSLPFRLVATQPGIAPDDVNNPPA